LIRTLDTAAYFYRKVRGESKSTVHMRKIKCANDLDGYLHKAEQDVSKRRDVRQLANARHARVNAVGNGRGLVVQLGCSSNPNIRIGIRQLCKCGGKYT
jgi:hypothetical protein